MFYERNAEGRGYFLFKQNEEIGANMHFHGAIEFLFIQEGSRTVNINGKRKILHAGEACFVDSFTPHEYEWGGQGTCYVLLGNGEYFQEIFSALGGKPPLFFLFQNFELLKILYNFNQRCHANIATKQTMFSGSLKLLLSVISQTTSFSFPEQDKGSILVCQILKYAEEHICEDLSLRCIAKQLGYSHEYLSRILHTHLFENWSSYVNRLRAQYVHKILEDNKDKNTPVLQIALECGFNSANTFYRAYRKEFGHPPNKKSINDINIKSE